MHCVRGGKVGKGLATLRHYCQRFVQRLPHEPARPGQKTHNSKSSILLWQPYRQGSTEHTCICRICQSWRGAGARRTTGLPCPRIRLLNGLHGSLDPCGPRKGLLHRTAPLSTKLNCKAAGDMYKNQPDIWPSHLTDCSQTESPHNIIRLRTRGSLLLQQTSSGGEALGDHCCCEFFAICVK